MLIARDAQTTHCSSGQCELEDACRDAAGFPTARERLAEVLLRRGDLSGAREARRSVLEKALQAGGRFRSLAGQLETRLFDVEWRAGNWQLAERYSNDAWSAAVEEAEIRGPQAELPERRARLAASGAR